MTRPRLVVADGQTLVLEGLKRLLETDFDVVGTAGDGRTAIELALTLQPDAILMDVSLPKLNGIDAARHLKNLAPAVKVVFVTAHCEPDCISEALRAGASGYLLKRSGAGELTAAVQEIVNGGFYIAPAVGGQGVVNLSTGVRQGASLFRQLTPRQREVLQLVAEGMPAKQVASELHLSRKTVEFHKAMICRALGVRTTAELVRYAVENGLVLRQAP